MCQMKWWFLNGARMLTTKKEYHECTDTMAQMKNKINETNKYPHRVFRDMRAR